MKKQTKIITFSICMLFCVNVIAQTKEKLIFALDLIRHGDRTSIGTIPAAPHQWPEGNGQLTEVGMNQEFQLGAKLRTRYIEQEHLLPSHYQGQAIYIRSTDVDRTLMSAQSFLLGLYPMGTGPYLTEKKISFLNIRKPALPNAHQPIPIHTVPQSQDDVFFLKHQSQHFRDAVNKYVNTNPEWQQKNMQLKNKFSRWSTATGVNINDINDLITLGDDLFIYRLKNIPLPAGLSNEDVNEIINAGKWAFVYGFKSKEMGILTGKPLLAAVINYVQNASQKKDGLKYVLLSGHDSSILGILSAMGAPLSLPPSYASDVNFSLYQDGQRYTVKVKFNDKPVVIPRCGSDTCTLEQFIALG